MFLKKNEILGSSPSMTVCFIGNINACLKALQSKNLSDRHLFVCVIKVSL